MRTSSAWLSFADHTASYTDHLRSDDMTLQSSILTTWAPIRQPLTLKRYVSIYNTCMFALASGLDGSKGRSSPLL